MSGDVPTKIVLELAAVHVPSCSQHLAGHGTAGVPLSYDDVTTNRGSPPRYNTLFRRVQNVRRFASGLRDLARNVSKVFFSTLPGTALCGVMTGFTLALPIAMLIMGCIKLNDCPAQPLLPIWLIAGAAPMLIRNAMSSAMYEHNFRQNNRSGVFTCIGLAFQFAWFVTGCVWLYGLHPAVHSPGADPTHICDHTLVTASFMVLHLVYVAAGLALMCSPWVLMSACAKPTRLDEAECIVKP